MPDSSTTIALSAALIAGIAGSVHCFAMCGGVAGALSMRTRIATAGSRSVLRDACLYQSGRLGGYALAGASFGLLGTTLQSSVDLPGLAALVRLAGGVLVMLVAIRLLGGWNGLAWTERLGARLWKNLHPLMRRAASGRGAGRSVLLGLLWGWLPCGLVYSMLLFAALSGDAFRGAAIMLAFGVGTLPSMLASSVFASQLNRLLSRHGARQLSGAVLLAFGLWLAWAGLASRQAVHHHHQVTIVRSPAALAAAAPTRSRARFDHPPCLP